MAEAAAGAASPFSEEELREIRNSTCKDAAVYRGEPFRRMGKRGRYFRKPVDYSYRHGRSNPVATDQLHFGKIGERNLISSVIQGGEGRNLGYGVTLTKVLAVGGYGIAALVEYQPPQEGAEKIKCVMKLDLYGVDEIQNEEYYLKVRLPSLFFFACSLSF